MSDEEKTTDGVDSVEEVVEAVSKAAAEVTETVSEVVSEATEKVTDTVAEASEGSAVSKIMDLKDSNPKVFFGAIAGLVLVILIMVVSGGDDKAITAYKPASLVIGNTYSLKGINSYGDNVKIRLVAVPGSIAAYDESEKEGNEGNCKDIPEGTKVKLLQVQEAFGGAKFVNLEIMDGGECAGKTGWASANNLN